MCMGDDIIMDLRKMRSEPLDYIQLTQDKVQCLVLFNTVVNPSVYITIEFLHQLSDYMHPSIYL